MEFEERPISSKTVFHGHLIDVEVQQVITHPYLKTRTCAACGPFCP